MAALRFVLLTVLLSAGCESGTSRDELDQCANVSDEGVLEFIELRLVTDASWGMSSP
jgi:hypothetical protein